MAENPLFFPTSVPAPAETYEAFLQRYLAISKVAPDEFLKVVKGLKAGGFYKGKVTKRFTRDFISAIAELDSEIEDLAKLEPESPLVTRENYIAGIAPGDGGTGARRNQNQTYIYSATQAAKVLDAVSEDLLGRKLTKSEKKKYTSLITAAQRKNPTRQTGLGTGDQTTQGPLDAEQFATEKLAGTAEAKQKRATDAYSVMMEELGGLR